MELEWKEPIQIPDGSHQGKIIKIEKRDEPYEYTDVIVKLDTKEIELKYGCPTTLSENSRLGRLVQMFGEKPKPKQKLDIEKVLVGKRVDLMTITKKNKEGREFSEIVEDSIKPEVQKNIIEKISDTVKETTDKVLS